MKKIILFILVCFVSSTFVHGQCKVKDKGAYLKGIEKRIPIEIDFITKPRVLFDKYFVAATNTFAKTTDGEYYFIIPFGRAYSSKFELNEDTPIIFYLEDGEELSLNPDGNIEGKMVLTTFSIFLYYKISKEQVEKLATKNIISLRIYFISEKEIADTFEDDLGRYYEFEIHSDKYRTNVFDAANCILQIN